MAGVRGESTTGRAGRSGRRGRTYVQQVEGRKNCAAAGLESASPVRRAGEGRGPWKRPSVKWSPEASMFSVGCYLAVG